MQEKWYKRLLCGYNPLGDFADVACRGTEVDYELSDLERYARTIEVRCWCCTFWRGVVLGAALGGMIVGGIYCVFT